MSVKRVLKRRSSFKSANLKLPSLTSPNSKTTSSISNDITEVYNCASSISLLDGRSEATVRLPSIHELDMMIDSSDRMALDNDTKWVSSQVTHESTFDKKRIVKQRRLYPAPPLEFKQQQPAQCHSCKSMETPEWRKGPLGPRTLCNACGLIWIKLCKQQDKKKNTHKTLPVEPCSAADSETTNTNNNDNNNNKYTLSFLLC